MQQPSSGPSPSSSPTSNPFGHISQLSQGETALCGFLQTNESTSLKKNLFPLTQLGPLWPRKMARSSLLWKFLPPIQFHRRLVRLKQGWEGGVVSSNKLPGVHGAKYNRAITLQRGLALSNPSLGPTACQQTHKHHHVLREIGNATTD